MILRFIIICRYFWGWLTDKYGRRPCILISAIFTAVATLAFGFTTNIYWALTTRFLQGLFNGIYCRGIFRTQSRIYDGVFFAQIVKKSFKKLHLRLGSEYVAVLLLFFHYLVAETFYKYLKRNRSSHWRRCSVKKGVLGNFAKFTGKHLCQSLFFNKVAGLTPAALLKKRLWHRCFPVNLAKFLRARFLQSTSGQLLLEKTSTF